MGRRKTQAASMGKTIIRDRFRGKRTQGQGSYLHTADLNDGYDWGRLNLQSVTEQSNLEEFLMTAELANTEFVAEKLNVQIVSPQQRVGLLSRDEMQDVKAAQEKHKDLLRIPRRPAWDEHTTAEELDRAEKESFVKWLHQLSKLKEKKHVELTPYEVNLEFWRQLWRVIEMSDVVVQIVDARNPLLFWCPDLDKYVQEVSSSKVTAILINKADYLTKNQRKAWMDYFTEHGITVLFFSALEETKKLEETKREQKLSQSDTGIEDCDKAEDTAEDKESDISEDEEKEQDDDDDDDDDDTKIAAASHIASQTTNLDSSLTVISSSQREEDQVDHDVESAKSTVSHETEESVSAELGADNTDTAEGAPCTGCKDKTCEKAVKQAESCEDCGDCQSNALGDDCHLHTTEELLDVLRSLAKVNYRPGVTTVGMVGYPNVGKSSTINSILKRKKVPVSATPGRTKTYQTVYVDKDLMLCDCPGLVFPSFVTTKADQVVNGILSIDQLRDHIGPVSLVCERIPREILEVTYGINLPLPADWEDPDRAPTAWELLNTYGYMRGYMTQNGNPDCPRTARYVLKDYVNGKLLFCDPPPGIEPMAFQAPPYTEGRGISKKKSGDKLQSSAKSMASRLDREFFTKMTLKGHTQGPHSIRNYARSEGLQQIAAANKDENQGSRVSSPYSSQQSLTGKPWKRHNNRNKKEKLRRVFADHDKY